eukprot:gene14429-19365_t
MYLDLDLLRKTSNLLAKVVKHLHTINKVKELRSFVKLKQGKTIGFVPTMGALHQGHISLINQAKKNNDIVIVSIFVNPTQFSPGEDLNKYPRQIESDVLLLKNANVDYLFAPSELELYPSKPLCKVVPTAFNQIHEGKARPDYFNGLTTVVCKLFNIVTPTNAYFGQKDVSQCIAVKRMVEDLNIPVNVLICENIRENDGLAMSSRNAYLSLSERLAAPILYKALNTAKDFCESSVVTITRDKIIEITTEILKLEPLVTGIEYVSYASHLDMTELHEYNSSTGGVLSSAIRIGKVRLIDNVLIGPAAKDMFL